MTLPAQQRQPGGPAGPPPVRAEVGVLTVIPQEARAVIAVLRQMYDYRERDTAHEAWLPDRHGRRVRVAAARALEPAAPTYRRLVEAYNPATVLLVGVGGGAGHRVRMGDVVLGDQVIEHVPGRRAATVSADLAGRLDGFLTTVPGEQLRPGHGSFRLHRGPIGAGGALVTDAASEIRRWLYDLREPVLAVETEAAGAARAFHECVRADRSRAWLTIRGISDTADASQGHGMHALAAAHAAEVMAMLLPYLYFPAS